MLGPAVPTCFILILPRRAAAITSDFPPYPLATSPSALCLEQIDAPLVLDFLRHLERDRKNGARTRNARLAAIKSLMRFVEYRVPSAIEQVGRIRAIPLKRYEARLIPYLKRDELQAVLDAPFPSTRMGIRDRALIAVASAAGLRVSELVGLCLQDITLGARVSGCPRMGALGGSDAYITMRIPEASTSVAMVNRLAQLRHWISRSLTATSAEPQWGQETRSKMLM